MSPKEKHPAATPVRKILGIEVPANGTIPNAAAENLIEAFTRLLGRTKKDDAAIRKLTRALPDKHTAQTARYRMNQYNDRNHGKFSFIQRLDALLKRAETVLPDKPVQPVGRMTMHHTVGLKPVARVEQHTLPKRPERRHRVSTTNVISSESFLPSGTGSRGILHLKPQTKERSRDDE